MSWRQSLVQACTIIAGPAFRGVHAIRGAAYKSGLFHSYEADVPVISVGNLAIGGTGKTPLVIWLAARLSSLGIQPAVASRGYRGTNKEPYLVASDGTGGSPLHGPSVVGDEPYLIACRLPTVPVLVGRKRMHPLKAAQDLFAIDVILLDDGFQHLAAARDLDLVVLTGSEDHMLPFIQLREPLSALGRAHAFLLPRPKDATDHPQWLPKHLPTFYWRLGASSLLNSPFPFEAVNIAELANKKVTLASAIARPERFLATAKKLGWNVASHVTFRDHHFFTERELQRLLSDNTASEIVFTEKDWVKLPRWFQGHERTWALRIDVVVEEEEAFLHFVTQRIGRKVREDSPASVCSRQQ